MSLRKELTNAKEWAANRRKSRFSQTTGVCELFSAIRKISIITKIVGLLTLMCLIFGFFIPPLISILPIIAIFVLISILMVYRIFLTIISKDFSFIVEPMIVVAILAGIIFSPVRLTGVYVRFFVEKSTYERVVESIKTGNVDLTGKDYILDSVSPLRVAFPWYGMADNWFGICYDPTGLVMNANILKGDYSNVTDPEYRKAGGLYGGGCAVRIIYGAIGIFVVLLSR